jgi:hypothetical protein
MARRSVVLVVALAILVAFVAIPAFAADKSAKDKSAKSPITVTGTIGTATDADGAPSYTLRSGRTTYTLEAGPAWFFGDNNPLKAFVGKSVTVSGERAAGSNEIDVETVNGKQIRAGGKPPWAGGWKRVGKTHPGWSQEKADRFKARFGDCFPPGQCKQKQKKSDGS